MDAVEWLFVSIALAFVVYRITRFLIEDTLLEEPRYWLERKVRGSTIPPKSGLRKKLLALMECPYCVSVWVAAGTVALATLTGVDVPHPFWTWLVACGITMTIWKHTEAEED